MMKMRPALPLLPPQVVPVPVHNTALILRRNISFRFTGNIAISLLHLYINNWCHETLRMMRRFIVAVHFGYGLNTRDG